MEQRIYYGHIDSNALADHLIRVFHQPPAYYQQHRTMAQKIVQPGRIIVQIMRTSDWSGSGHRALGIHIFPIAGGVSIEMGSSDWLDLDEGGLAGMLLGALLFPPLLLFPLIHGLSSSTFSQDVWNVVDVYCMQPASASRAHTSPGFYCTYCGAFNHPHAPRCHSCSAPFNVAPPPQPESPAQPPQHSNEQSAPVAASAPPSPEPVESTEQAVAASAPPPSESVASTEQATSAGSLVICPNCHATVAFTNFCGNCAAPLRDLGGKAAIGE